MKSESSTGFLDPIVKEIREIKIRLAEKYDFDVRTMLKDAQKKQNSGKRKVIKPK
jgi:hypothetical protein